MTTPQASADDVPDPAGSRAVLIAVPRYERMADLPATAENVRELKRLLTDPAVWGLKDEHVVCLDGETVTRNDVLATVHGAAREARDALVVYFAGHGLVESFSSALHLAMASAWHEKLFEAVRYEDLRRELLSVSASVRLKVVILDCCFSGKALNALSDDPGKGLAEQAAIHGTCVLTACAETSLALAPEDETYTAFTGEIVDVLSRGIPGLPRLLTADMIHKHVHQSLASKSRPLPQISGRNGGAAVPLVRNRAPAVLSAGVSRRQTDRYPLSVPAVDTAQTLEDVVIEAVRAAIRLLDADISMICQHNGQGLWRVVTECRSDQGAARTPNDPPYAMGIASIAGPASQRWWEQLGSAAGVLEASDGHGEAARAALLRRRGQREAVIAQVVVDGALWGEVIGARAQGRPDFTGEAVRRVEWLARALASAIQRVELIRQRDEARRTASAREQEVKRLELERDLWGRQER